MKRTRTFRGQVDPTVRKNGERKYWEVLDEKGFVFASLPFGLAFGVRDGEILITVTPLLKHWFMLSEETRDRIDLVELCLSKQPLTEVEQAAFPGRELFLVAPDSPWYSEAAEAPSKPARRRRPQPTEPEQVVVPSPWARRFVLPED